MPPGTTQALQLTLDTGQILSVALNLQTVTDRQLLVDIAAAQVAAEVLAKQRAEIETRTYHMGKKATAGLEYDDRLTRRLKCSPGTAYAYLSAPVKHGGLRNRRLGNKYHITERAIRDFEGEPLT